MNIGHGARLARMVQFNGGFDDWPTNQSVPWHWIPYTQASYYVETGTTLAPLIPGGRSLQIYCGSQSNITMLAQFLDGYVGSMTPHYPVDAFLDSRPHRLRFGAWIKPIAPYTNSGDLGVRVTIYGNDANSSYSAITYHPGGTDWKFIEAISSRTFTGSNYAYVGFVRKSNGSNANCWLAYARTMLDEQALLVGQDLLDRAQALQYDNDTRIGRSRYYRAAKPAWRLPVQGVESSTRHWLDQWQVAGHTLSLRLDSDSQTAAYSVQLVGEETPIAKLDGPGPDVWQGVLELEGI